MLHEKEYLKKTRRSRHVMFRSLPNRQQRLRLALDQDKNAHVLFLIQVQMKIFSKHHRKKPSQHMIRVRQMPKLTWKIKVFPNCPMF